jgi:hypothetical protein
VGGDFAVDSEGDVAVELLLHAEGTSTATAKRALRRISRRSFPRTIGARKDIRVAGGTVPPRAEGVLRMTLAGKSTTILSLFPILLVLKQLDGGPSFPQVAQIAHIGKCVKSV